MPLPKHPDPVPRRPQDAPTSMLLDLHVTTAGRYTVVDVAGVIDVASAPELRDCLNQTINAGSRQLVVDLRQVSFMDSEGLGVLVGAHRRLLGHQHHDRSIHLVCAANGLVARILRLTGLDRVFPLHASLADALGDAGQADD
jgi:anti-sigma B factor antagonist